jgi:hypothetical protein
MADLVLECGTEVLSQAVRVSHGLCRLFSVTSNYTDEVKRPSGESCLLVCRAAHFLAPLTAAKRVKGDWNAEDGVLFRRCEACK